MRKNKLFNRLLVILCLPMLILSCDDSEDISSSVDFATIASTYAEKDGTRTITIPFRNGNSSVAENVSVIFGGTATAGKDYSLVGITEEGVQISIIDDNDLELTETVRVQLVSSSINLNGNNIHTITIESNCEDKANPFIEYFAGTYEAIEKYGPNPPASNWYGPYEIGITQNATNPNRFDLDNFYDNNYAAYIVFDLAAGTVSFPNQTIGGKPLTASTGTFAIDDCNGSTLTITLNYDGGNWTYAFKKL